LRCQSNKATSFVLSKEAKPLGRRLIILVVANSADASRTIPLLVTICLREPADAPDPESYDRGGSPMVNGVTGSRVFASFVDTKEVTLVLWSNKEQLVITKKTFPSDVKPRYQPFTYPPLSSIITP
jgi:hypothetical protein